MEIQIKPSRAKNKELQVNINKNCLIHVGSKKDYTRISFYEVKENIEKECKICASKVFFFLFSGNRISLKDAQLWYTRDIKTKKQKSRHCIMPDNYHNFLKNIIELNNELDGYLLYWKFIPL